MATIGQQLRALREQRRLRQKDVRAQIGISEQYLSEIERSQRLNIEDMVQKLNRIALFYGYEVIVELRPRKGKEG